MNTNLETITMQPFVEKLREAARLTGSIVCFGMDPTEKVFAPLGSKTRHPLEFVKFYDAILTEMKSQGINAGSFKPNDAFWRRWDRPMHGDFAGSAALAKTIQTLRQKQQSIPIIFDAKRGDIGNTSAQYAEEFAGWKDQHSATEYGWNVDAVTVAPYMGTDSVEPFLGKLGVYVLNRTSNSGARDFQNNPSESPLYLQVADKIIEWSRKYPGNVGAVIGATAPDELEAIAARYVESGQSIPLLIPGVGKQGGSASEVISRLKKAGYDLSIVRINSSSELNFAFEKENTVNYAGAAVRALKKLNDEIGPI